MKNLKPLIIKVVILSFFVLCLLTTLVCAQENNELQLYNRNEKVQLSKALIRKNDRLIAIIFTFFGFSTI